MPFITFKLIYFTVGLLTAGVSYWLLRKSKHDLLILTFMTFIMFAMFFSLYLDSAKHSPSDDISELLLRALTHVRRDLVLTVSNVLLWGTVPFAVGILIKKRRRRNWLVWIFFLLSAMLKTFFDDSFIVHQYPEMMSFGTFEWEYVIAAWSLIYTLAALLITKGIELLRGSII